MQLPSPPETGNPNLDVYLNRVRQFVEYEGPVECIFGWVADNVRTVSLGKLPADAYVLRAHLQVTEAFNSSGTDEIQCGWNSDNDAIFTLTDVSTTGIKTVTLGANAGYNSTIQDAKAYYVNGGTLPSTGKAIIMVEFIRLSRQIA